MFECQIENNSFASLEILERELAQKLATQQEAREALFIQIEICKIAEESSDRSTQHKQFEELRQLQLRYIDIEGDIMKLRSRIQSLLTFAGQQSHYLSTQGAAE